MDLVVRRAVREDVPQIAEMCQCLWPDASAAEHARSLIPVVTLQTSGTLAAAIFLALTPDGQPIGFVEVGLRSHADGCDPAHPVGFIEGWYVAPAHRGQRVGARLLAIAEDWARSQGCTEMASDTWIDNVASQLAHEALGFEVVDRCIHYRKTL